MRDIPKSAGIYKLTCINNNKIYIGKSVNLYVRLPSYKRCGKDIGPYIKNAILKHGWDSFKIDIIEIFEEFDKSKDSNSLLDRESHYIKLYNSTNTDIGYNICDYSTDKTGMKMSDESREKMSKSHMGVKHSEERKLMRVGRKLTPEHIQNIANANRGKKRTDETKEKLRIANSKPKTTPVSDSHRANLSKAGRGRTLTEEHKEKLRLSAIKRGISKETREKMRQTNKGRPLSEEHKAKLRNKKLSPEHKESLRKSNIGRTYSHTEKTKEKMRLSALNRKSKNGIL